MPDRRELVYVSAERFEAVLKERGLYDLDQVARDIGTYPDTLKYRLRMGSFLPYMAEKLENVYGLTPQDYAPIILLDTTDEDSPVLTDEEVERIAERVAQKIKELIK
jgi:hypothetical protein